jgi:phosphodiester glycosidase
MGDCKLKGWDCKLQIENCKLKIVEFRTHTAIRGAVLASVAALVAASGPGSSAPAKKPAKKSNSTRAKSRPSNASEVRGLYTVEKQGSGVYYRKGYVLGVGVNVIEADLSDPEVKVGAMVAERGIGTDEGFGQMVRRARPAAAITGTFFGIRSRVPTGDLVINGQPIFRGFIGTAVAITEGNVVSFIPTKYKDQAVDWSLFDTVIRGGPRLVDRGNVVMTARSEGFRSLPIRARRTRTAIGLTRDNHLQFVAIRQGITLWELAKVMRAVGAYHAVALDGGTSTAMYFAGRYVARPGRGLTNVLLIYHRKERYEDMRHEFAGPYVPRPTPKGRMSIPEPHAPASVMPRIQAKGTGFEPAQELDFPLDE